MADIAAIFGWTPDVMDQMSYEDLVLWHGRALKRWKAMNGAE